MNVETARQFALSLPETTEQPHFEKSSFRVRGKIYATVPADGDHLHIFVDEMETRAAIAENPETFEELWWGKKLAGMRITLSKANEQLVIELLQEAWRMRAPNDLIGSLESSR